MHQEGREAGEEEEHDGDHRPPFWFLLMTPAHCATGTYPCSSHTPRLQLP